MSDGRLSRCGASGHSVCEWRGRPRKKGAEQVAGRGGPLLQRWLSTAENWVLATAHCSPRIKTGRKQLYSAGIVPSCELSEKGAHLSFS